MPHVRCPGCKTRYTVPADAGGKRTKCRQCGQPFRIPEFKTQPPPDDEPLRLADLDALAGGAAVPDNRPRAATTNTAALPEAIAPERAVAYAAGAAAPADVGRGAYGRYFASLAQTLMFPAHMGSLATLLVLWAILSLTEALYPFMCFLGPFALLIVTGWYMSFQLNTVVGGAAAEDEIPTLALTGGWWDDIVAPSLKMLFINVIVWVPAIICLLAGGILNAFTTAAGAGPGAGGGAFTWTGVTSALDPLAVGAAIALVVAGYFLKPMIVLVVAVGTNVLGVVRLDLMLRTIVKSLPAYLLTVFIVYLSIGSYIGFQFIAGVIAESAGTGPGSLVALFGLPALLKFVEIYFTIVAMRMIGLYYHHFKHRFAWSWG